jgi:CRISPR/Cas system CMR subunit Cmr6 (Cas7 group RAMP superfamily)
MAISIARRIAILLRSHEATNHPAYGADEAINDKTYNEKMLKPIQKANDDFQKTADQFQKMSKDNYDAMVRSYGDLNKSFQAIAASGIALSVCKGF